MIDATVPIASTAAASLERAVVDAGESVPMTLVLDAPPAASLLLNGQFSKIDGSDSFHFEVTLAAGSTVGLTKVVIPKDADGGDYACSGPCTTTPADATRPFRSID